MNFKNIEKWSLGYELLKFYVKFIHDKFFYRKVCITGLENIPKNKPVFFSPNHQNALMDALAILFAVKKQAIFVARSDIFKNPFIAKLLIFLKILPAYRIRDGKENLKKNDVLFDTSIRVLESHAYLTLFPETVHTDKRRLRILKKGIQRIVFQTEDANDFKLDIQIIPVGINYSNYWNFRSDIILNFGKPIPVSQFKEQYQESPQKAMNVLRDEMTKGMLPQMIHIETVAYYDTYENLREIYHTAMLKAMKLPNNIKNKFIADKKLIADLDKELKNNPDNIKSIDLKVKEYIAGLKRYNIRDWVLRKNTSWPSVILKSFLLLILSPVFLYGAINNIIPYSLHLPITKKLKDRQFTSSITFGFSILFFPIFYAIQTIIFYNYIEPSWLSWLYLISLPIIGLIAFNLHRMFIKLRAQWIFLINKEKAEFTKLIELRKYIISDIDTIINI
jgi:1-acyl-sn-glycerol-3-phosphate acyltransferase